MALFNINGVFGLLFFAVISLDAQLEVTQQSNQKRFNRQEAQLEKSLKKISKADPRTTAKHSTVRERLAQPGCQRTRGLLRLSAWLLR
jgi:hypothetical protein